MGVKLKITSLSFLLMVNCIYTQKSDPFLLLLFRAIQQLVQEESAALNFLARRGSEAERDSADSEGFVTDDDHAMANAERELAEDAEWKRIQQNTFTRWANEHLKQADKTISDLETDLSDGLKLISLIEVHIKYFSTYVVST